MVVDDTAANRLLLRKLLEPLGFQMRDASNKPVLTWKLIRAIPVKFKAADLNGMRTNEVAIEELHLVHEGLEFEKGGRR